jgi:large subunit ribosomal protein L15
MRLDDLAPARGAVKSRTRIGRGHGSGRVKTGGKGTKGQLARAGGGKGPFFEGGQLPLIRKLPYRRGFKNPFRKEYGEVNVRDLADLPAGATVGPEEFATLGVLHGEHARVKVLGEGDLHVRLTVRAHRFTRSARAKIEAAGGSIEEIGAPVAEPSPESATDN